MSFSKRGLNEEREKTSGLKEKNKKNKKTKQIPESMSGPLDCHAVLTMLASIGKDTKLTCKYAN